MNEYVTASELKRELGIEDYQDDDDALLLSKVEQASRLWDRLTRRRFYPRIETRYFDHPATGYELPLDDDLLEVTTFATNQGNTTLTAGNYWGMRGRSYQTPYTRLALNTSAGGTNYLTYTTTPQRANVVTGVWGYHDDYSSAWLLSNDALAAAVVSTTATTLTVSDALDTDIYGLAPRFRVGNLLKIDTEYLYVTAVTPTTLTVRRGVNGSTAATHLLAATIYRWATMAVVQQLVTRMAAWIYKQKDSQVFDTIASQETGTVTIPVGLPADVKAAVPLFRRVRL